jgi:hypothetical protein
MRIRLLIFAIFLVLMLTASAQDNTSPTAQDNTKSIPKNEAEPFNPYLFGIIVVFMIGVALFPYTFNMWQSHKHLTQVHKDLGGFIDKHADKIDSEKLVQIIDEYIHAKPMGAPGTARAVMALSITMIIGLALFFMFAFPANITADDNIKEILLALTGALTAIVGFYFGGKTAESKPSEPKPTVTTPPVPEEPPKAEEPKSKLYNIMENFVHEDKQYNKGETMDLANISDDILKGWVETKKIEPYVGETKDLHKELEGKPGWYTIKVDFRYNDDYYFAGNNMKLTDIPASILEGWIARKWIEPYKGPTA